MRSDKTDEMVAEFLDKARPPYTDTSRERALSEMSRAHGERPVRSAARKGRWVLRTATATAVVALGLGLLFLPRVRPVSAEAALRRVVAASEGVHTSHLVFWMELPGGIRETNTFWYAEGKWHLEDWRGSDLVRVQVHDGERSHFYNADDNTVHLNASDSPFGTPFRGFTVAAMLESIGDDLDVTMEKTRAEDGRPVNRIVITTWNQHTPTERTPRERFILLADPQTDLPLSWEVLVSIGDEWQLVGGTETVEYNLAVDPTLFVLDYPPDARVIDRDKLSQEWQQRYDRGLDRIQTVEGDIILRDFQVTALGDVAAIWTGTSSSAEARLTDSIGTSYLRVRREFQARSDPCAWFIPVSPPSSQPAWYALVIGDHEFRVPEPAIVDGPDPMYPPCQHVRGEVAFISPGGAGAEMSRARVRAEYWRSHGDPERAVGYYEKMVGIAEAEYHATYVNADTWIAIGELYEEMGRGEQALSAYERGLQALEVSPNRNTPPERELADELHAKVQRLR
ncbi:MAG: tetratricopeptide repeat protein [Armatimonadota bacterium]|nr:MAG: tetratricopeptide repeat protein [Armatimonadota bacterium]